ncbi:DUF1801 domain-containing protein [Henriciella sp.]|uniref:DUF1801 domain-containing protein n=1 Tax=Henriciella sp. TaxID=1968823 RepID=UPI002603C8AD|nr:DUF1801 domain-containing protein [Henriciella sp.]
MWKADNKTQPTAQTPESFIARIENETRRQDGFRLLDIFREATNLAPRMWGPSIIGYGRYHYKYESGREGDFLMTGFSPRKAHLAIYILPGYRDMGEPLSRLGKHKLGKSCLYINKLADVDEAVLSEIIRQGVQYMRAKYETWEE